jgi:NADH-quinone oxidoreductase subunit K
MIPSLYYLLLSGILFGIGLLGIVLNRRNLIVILMSIELLLLSININFVTFSRMLSDLTGQVFTLFILTIAAAEAAIGLAILVVYYRKKRDLHVDDLSELKG